MLTAGHQPDLGDKLEWAQLDDAGAPRTTALGALDGQKASVYLGPCSACSATVTTVRTLGPRRLDRRARAGLVDTVGPTPRRRHRVTIVAVR